MTEPAKPPYASTLDGKLKDAQRTWRSPSVAAVVTRDGEAVWSGAVGSAVVGELDASYDVAYRLGSISKTFTAVLIHQLLEDGALALDDTLAKHLPGTVHGDITLRRLLSHTSGLQREPGDQWITLEPLDRQQLLDVFEQAEQVLPPRTVHHYSNLGYAILGEVAARLNGGTWEEALQARLLGPLGMTRTGAAPSGPTATGYFVDPYADAVRPEPDLVMGSSGAAGQLWSTTTDMAKWAAFLADPDPAVLTPETLDAMRQPLVVFDPAGWNLAWGSGLMLWRRGERVLHGHGGAMPGFLAGCYAFRNEVEKLGACVLTNTGRGADAEGLAAELIAAVIDADPRRKPVWTPALEVPAELVPLLGVWWTEGQEILFEWRDGWFSATGRGGAEPRRTKFEKTGPDAWQAVAGREQGERLTVIRTPDGSVDRMAFAGYAYTRQAWTFRETADSRA